MSDHVGTLLSIELGAAPVLAPRPVSLYEPGQPEPADAREEVPEVAVTDSARVRPQRGRALPAREPDVESESPLDPRDRLDDFPQPMAIAQAAAGVATEAAFRTQPQVRDRLPAPAHVDDVEEIEGPLLVPPPPARVREGSHDAADLPRADSRRSPQAAALTASQRPVASVPSRTRERGRSVELGPHERGTMARPDNAAAAPGRSVRTATYATAERMFAVEGPVQAGAADSSPPTVVVSIGRVEVRAAAKESHAPAPRSRSDSLSLEAYLRRGARGNR